MNGSVNFKANFCKLYKEISKTGIPFFFNRIKFFIEGAHSEKFPYSTMLLYQLYLVRDLKKTFD